MRLSSRPDVLRLQAKRDVSGLVQALGYRADAGIQDTASSALIAIGEPALPPLIRALATPNLQAPAMTTLRKMGVLSIDSLINVLKTDKRASVRTAAVSILSDIGMFAIEPLVVTLVHKETDVRNSAIDALIAIGSLAVEPLISQAQDKSHPVYVRIDSLRALAQLGGSQATSALLVAAQNDSSPEVREYAAKALGRSDILVKPAPLASQPVPEKNRPRGLSHAFRDKDEEEKKNTDADSSELINYRWSRVRQVLPHLKPIPFDVLQRLLRTHSVHRKYSKPFEVLEDLDREFTQYSRVKESAYADVSVKIVFDNEVTQSERVIPATRQLDIIIVCQESQYFVFLNPTYLEHYW